MSSATAYLAASPAEVAVAVLFVGFGDLVVTPSSVVARVSMTDVFHATANATGALEGLKAGSAKWFAALDSDPVEQIRRTMLEVVLFAEQRLCLCRETTAGTGNTAISLLRRGQALLWTGDAATYLG